MIQEILDLNKTERKHRKGEERPSSVELELLSITGGGVDPLWAATAGAVETRW
jgi:hypothetical protein